jgi:FKBP-type peptidyl-prolyl cis-trans isomerase FklB
MKFSMSVLVASGLLAFTAGAQESKQESKQEAKQESKKTTAPAAAPAGGELKDFKAKSSYAIGLNFGKQLRMGEVDADLESLVRGIHDGFGGGKVRMTDAEINETMLEFQKVMQAKAGEKFEKIKKESRDFIAANAKKPGVKSTKSGLQYRIIKEGAGRSPKATDLVTVHYRGTLIDDREFDSSYKRGEPAQFNVNRVIPGWTEGLQLMKEGSKWMFFIPTELAYNDRPREGGIIRPGDALIFEVELIKAEPAN